MSLETFLEDAIRRAIREELKPLLRLLPPVEAGRPAEKSLLLVGEIATACDVESPTVCSWISSGKLKATKPGRHYLVRRTDFEEFLTAQQQVATPVDAGEQVRKLMARVNAKKESGNG